MSEVEFVRVFFLAKANQPSSLVFTKRNVKTMRLDFSSCSLLLACFMAQSGGLLLLSFSGAWQQYS